MNNDTEKELEHEIMKLETILANKKEKLERLKFIHANRRYYLNWDGSIHEMALTMNDTTKASGTKQGNVFKTVEDAEKERDRRALLYEFNQFKNERNNGWTPNWNDISENKNYIYFGYEKVLLNTSVNTTREFVTFGYFRNDTDCMDAIKKFGDRIKKLYID
jgi:hypothetical protein|nr:MAG TPA: hypothetical protein [Caudoviricetes sp.]